jgi:hypothetical protein
MTRPLKSTVTFKHHAKFVTAAKSIYIQSFKLNEHSTETSYLPRLFVGQGGEKVCSWVAFVEPGIFLCVFQRPIYPRQHSRGPRRYQPAQLAAAVIIGIVVAIIVLILYRGVWL